MSQGPMNARLIYKFFEAANIVFPRVRMLQARPGTGQEVGRDGLAERLVPA